MHVSFERREELAPTIWQYYFRPVRPYDYTPGQYADFHLPEVIGDRRGASRVFTLTSIPTDSWLSFAAKFELPMTPYKHGLQNLQPGDSVRIDDAMGDVVLPKHPSIPLVFIAGGLGIASLVSILRELERTQETRAIDLFYARRLEADNPYKQLIERFPLKSFRSYVNPERLNVSDVLPRITAASQVYISGSERFVENLRKELETNGVQHEQIVFDFFDGYSEL